MACDRTSILKKARDDLGLNSQQMQALAKLIPSMMEIKKSEPMDEDTEGNYEVLLEKNQTYNSVKVKEVLHKLMEYDTVKIGSEQAKALEDALTTIVDPVVRAVPEMQIMLNKEAARNNGLFQVTEDGAKVKLSVGVTAQNYNQMSAAEKYVHEMVHAATHFAMKYAKQEVAGTVNRLIDLRDEAMKVLTVDDMMPEITMNEKLDREIAQARLDYINTDLEEFLAYAVTNENVRKKLETLEVYKKKEKDQGIVSKILGFLSDMVNLALAKVRSEPRSMTGNALAMKLMKELMSANNRAERKYTETKLDQLNDKITELESKWEEWVDKAKDYSMKKVLSPKPINGSKMDNIIWTAANLRELMFNKDMRGPLEQTLRGMGLGVTGVTQSVLNTMSEDDDHGQRVVDIMMWSGQVERDREGMAGTIGGLINEGFEKLKVKEKHRQAIYKMVKDDTLMLLDEYGDGLAELVKDEAKLEEELGKLNKELKAKADPKRINMYERRIDDLVNYMLTGEGTLITAPNAEAIAKNVGTPDVDVNVGQDLIDLIDKIVSLKNLRKTSDINKEVIVEMLETDMDGMKVVREMQRGAELQVKERMGYDAINYHKGNIREVYDDAVTVAVAPLKEAKEMLAKGYTEVVKLPRAEALKELGEPMAMYISKDMIRQKHNRTTFRYTGEKQEGHTVFEDLMKSGTYTKELLKEMRSRLKTAQTTATLNAIVGEKQDLDNVLRPVYDSTGRVVDYRYNVTMENKMKYMGLELDGIEGIARTWAHEVDVRESGDVNKAAFQEVVYQMGKDYRMGTTGFSQHEYVALSKHSKNPLIREYMKILPKDVKGWLKELENAEIDGDKKVTEELAERFTGVGWHELNKIEKEQLRRVLGRGEIFVREDMLYNLMGVRDMSVINAPLVKHAPRELKTILLKVENFWKEIISLFKVNIIIKTLDVIRENVVSNILYSIQTQQMPWTIMAEYKRGWDALGKFVEDEKALRKAMAKLVLDKDNKRLQMEVARIKDDMAQSPIKPLIDAGLYSHIIEDLNVDNFKSSSRVVNWMNDKMEGAPEIVKNGVNWLFMTEKTKGFQIIQSLTAKSDFIARYAQYTFGMQKAAKDIRAKKGRPATEQEMKEIEKVLLRSVRDEFVNYNKPDSPFLQYLNDMGVFMFTKYALRIQRIAHNMISKHPIRFTAALLAQEALESATGYNPSDTAESILFHKGMAGSWLYNPGVDDVLEQLATPAAYVYARDLAKIL